VNIQPHSRPLIREEFWRARKSFFVTEEFWYLRLLVLCLYKCQAVTNSMKQSRCWETNCSIIWSRDYMHLWNPKFHTDRTSTANETNDLIIFCACAAHIALCCSTYPSPPLRESVKTSEQAGVAVHVTIRSKDKQGSMPRRHGSVKRTDHHEASGIAQFIFLPGHESGSFLWNVGTYQLYHKTWHPTVGWVAQYCV
jgi:hypothetical protein